MKNRFIKIREGFQMKRIKNILSVLIAVLMCAEILPLGQFAGRKDSFSFKADAAYARSFHTGDTVYYGEYPQSKVTSNAIIAALNDMDPDENVMVEYEGVRYVKRIYRNAVQYYSVAPIAWRVLSNGEDGLFVVSERILYSLKYGADGNTTWDNSALRTWLNGSFLETAFTAEERSGIRNAGVLNDDNWQQGTPGGSNTTDKVFLLSITYKFFTTS